MFVWKYALVVMIPVALFLSGALAAEPEVELPLESLKGQPIPAVVERISGLDLVPNFVVDEDAAIALGKALFWDQQAGSDGQACASCHFNAGMDNRIKNQLSPGLLGGNGVFDPTDTGGIGPNYTMKTGDFPFHQFLDPTNRDSEVTFTTDDVLSSAGVAPSDFLPHTSTSLPPPPPIIETHAVRDVCDIVRGPGNTGDPVGFHVNDINVRRVEPRNTPTVINAVFNFRNFWDGRANNIFNGVDPFGRRNKDARVVEKYANGNTRKIAVEFENSSLASQAVGPPLSPFEMSCGGRLFANLGNKLLGLKPLGLQEVHPSDSVFGPAGLVDSPTGLSTTYSDMIKAAFDPRFWSSNKLFDADGNAWNSNPPADDQFTQMEINFSMFWGLAVQLYETSLISDDSPFDQFEDGGGEGGSNSSAMTAAAKAGRVVFEGNGRCINCHATAMFTKASTLHLIGENAEEGLVERMLMGQEKQVYTVLGDGTAGGVALDARNVGGSPTAPNVAATDVGVDVSGEFELVVSSVACTYTVDSFTLLIAPNGVSFTGAFASGDAGCVTTDVPTVTLLGPPGGPFTVTILVNGGSIGVDGVVASGDLRVREPAVYDNGHYNIGVTPTSQDIGIGGTSPDGTSLSFARQYVDMLLGKNVPDPFQVDECTFEAPFDPALDIYFFPGGFDPIDCDVDGDGLTDFSTGRPTNNAANQAAIQALRVAVDGAFKVPTLRNTELTGSFFHNGGQATLEQEIAFYNRGGDFFAVNEDNADPDIQPLFLSPQEMSDLKAFLESLTDLRVTCEIGPFDHPQLWIPTGHPGDETGVTEDPGFPGQATDHFHEIPAVGAAGISGCSSAGGGLVSFAETLAAPAHMDPPQISFVLNSTSVNEGAGTHKVKVFLDTGGGPLASSATVNVAVRSSSTAVGGGTDYTLGTTSVTFSAGAANGQQKNVSIPIVNDALDEFNETIDLLLTGDVGARTKHTATILDNDAPPKVSVADGGATESDGEITLAVTLSAPSAKTIKIRYATANHGGGANPATAGTDYTSKTAVLTFLPGQVWKSPRVTVIPDSLDEFKETFLVNLSNPSNVTIGDGKGVQTIFDDDPRPVVSVQYVGPTVEGDTARFAVKLSTKSGRRVRADYATADGSATAPGDYAEKSGTVTFNPGQTKKYVEVPTVQDALDEANETFTLEVWKSDYAILGSVVATATILDDDGAPGLSVVDAPSVTEGAGPLAFTVMLMPPSGQQVTVDYATANGTGLAGSDYTAASGTLTFAAGEITKTVSVAVTDDSLDEIDETVHLDLSASVNAAIAGSHGTGIIEDNDNVAPEVSVVVGHADGSTTAGYRSGEPVVLDVTFTDPGSADTHMVSLSWGDGGAPDEFTLAVGERSFQRTHSYGSTGTFHISVTVSDADGGSGSASNDVTVVDGPASAIITGPTVGADGHRGSFTATAYDTVGPVTFSWTAVRDSVVMGTGGGPVFDLTPPIGGMYEVSVVIHDDNGDAAAVTLDYRVLGDIGSNVFVYDIVWMASEGITKGCNPTANDKFCPNAVVTRAQMAAFLVRALGLTERAENPFVDDDGSIFEADIEKLAAAGITMGCNPPANDRFCPEAGVTRGAMAAFLVRAMGYTDNGGGNLFIDDDGSIFEGNIDKLAAAGITKGCNPPLNDKYCPDDLVTRGQMAAFLHRALG